MTVGGTSGTVGSATKGVGVDVLDDDPIVGDVFTAFSERSQPASNQSAAMSNTPTANDRVLNVRKIIHAYCQDSNFEIHCLRGGYRPYSSPTSHS
jgi:hypothetical protein